MTDTERSQHETAVRIRRMTDAQICAALEEQYQQGAKSAGGHTSPSAIISSFIERLDQMSGTGNGIGKSTVYKLRKFAEKEGFFDGV